jgi:hypothetical protein
MELIDDVENVIDGKPGVSGVYARNIGTGETVAIDGDRVLPRPDWGVSRSELAHVIVLA